MTVSTAQTACTVRKEKANQYKMAFKHAINVCVREKEKEKGRMSAQPVAEFIAKEFKVNLSARKIQRKVESGEIVTSPVRCGPKGSIPELHYRNILTAFESFVVINQINGVARKCHHKKLVKRVHKVLHSTDSTGSQERDFLKCILGDTAVSLNTCKTKSADEKRIR